MVASHSPITSPFVILIKREFKSTHQSLTVLHPRFIAPKAKDGDMRWFPTFG